MPLEYLFCRSKLPKHPIALTRGSERHILPSHLSLNVPLHLRAESGRDELRPKTDAQNRLVALKCCLHTADLLKQVGILAGLVRPHRAAENDQPVVTLDIDDSMRVSPE